MASAFNRSTIARPIPRAPPVTNATLAIASSDTLMTVGVPGPVSSKPFDAHGHAQPAAAAEGGQARGPPRAPHLVQQGGHHPRARGAHGVADGARPAAHVDLFRIEPQLAHHAKRLGGERLVV